MNVSKELQDKIFEVIEIAKTTGKVKKGTNEATKVIERGIAKLVVVASDVNPPEVTMHIEPLCREKGIPCVHVDKKEELGSAAGLQRPTSSVAVVSEGEAKDQLKEVLEKLKK